ncbi:hypothetical protein [Streptomyces coerulescens]|uniref:DUF5666 domain-containing protein n=1 Tax=Streptomyces coerulescens TaxID=29304 RepID=A0ABW0CRY4_STRCD
MTHDQDHQRRRSGRARAVTAAATVAALALGGTVAYAATSSGSGDGASPSASGPASPSPGEPGGRHGPGAWFGLGGGGVHGESTVRDPDTDAWVVRIWQRGTVEKVDGDQVTVKSEDGAEWTWTVGADTTVRHDGDKGSGTSALEKGDDIFLVGTRSDDGTRTATRALAGDWEARKKEKGKDRDGGPGDWRGRFPGFRHWDRPGAGPSDSPSHSDATT